MSDTPASFSSAVAVAGLAGGFLAARQTGRRELGGALFAAAGMNPCRSRATLPASHT